MCIEDTGSLVTRTTMVHWHGHMENLINNAFCYTQGYLDEQFIQLEELQDDANPDFVEEIVTLYYRDSSRLLSNIEQAL